ncbi:hypothetical protein ASPWEDRAFT_169285 [Aspergillus wentii DTO 134E9]|uniref:Uncharacterized protein n=1 Tax=Aspergillus wentii DTO 134E9 TaxID=1073089 RepID=A0A1L9RX74_ASPWE|nr:uncharacterized protein ASPWEDRAFT_169285 [Aspergillus wentii DTO 134E9]KAI9931876.1 hypothetical protein MW887_010460 [Aspergillus wentii]OJJ39438.1 hypothetical protein ASPWEDRAFT_169285 [Aspergillus wentii DTO 134E9]
MDHQLPLSPPSEPTPAPAAPSTKDLPVPLDSPIRTTPIHSTLPDLRVPNDPLPPHKYHPVTCVPIDSSTPEISTHLEQLREEYPSPEAALKAQEDVAKEVKQKMEDAEKKREEVQRAMDKKVKERNTEMKVLSKFQEVKASDIIPS